MNEKVNKLLKDLSNKKDCYFVNITGDSICDLLNYIEQLQHQFEQRDEVIDEINKFIEENGIDKEMAEICGRYDVNGIEIYKILQKYKEKKNEL